MATTYIYPPQPINGDQLYQEIIAAGLPAPTMEPYLDTSGNIIIVYETALTGPQKTTLDGVVAAHVPGVEPAPPGVDEKVKTTSNDTTGDYLKAKLLAGAFITLTENNDGAYETLTIAGTGGTMFYGCDLTASGDQSLANGTWTVLEFDGPENFDTAALHDPAVNPSRITMSAGMAGKWLVGGGVLFAGNPTGRRAVRFLLNGLTVVGTQFIDAVATGGTGLCITKLFHLNAAEFIELQLFQDSGGALLSTTGSGVPFFWAYRVGA
jgi:hypothetical protein